MIGTLSENPILLLFIVASLGYLVGSIKVRGTSLGVAAVLFTGLAIGAIDSSLQIPEVILLIGLSLYVYSIGLSSGPAFFNAYRKGKPRRFLFIIFMLLFSGFLAALIWLLTDFTAATVAGLYAGSTTNTAALAGVIDLITNTHPGTDFVQDTVVAYSFSYPMGVLGGMIAIVLMQRWLRIDFEQEKKELKKDYPINEKLVNIRVEVAKPNVCGVQLRDLFKEFDWNVVFGRIVSGGVMSLASWDTELQMGDIVMVVGSESDVDQVADDLGQIGESDLYYDRKIYDSRRIFVSNRDVVGRTIASLNISEKFDAVVTRIRRGDVDMLAKGNTVLEVGDRVRFLARRQDLPEISNFFGDSYHASSRINLFSFGLGIGLGLMLGTLEVSLFPGSTFKLGYAGGPLIVGLVLGAWRRTGSVVWTLPYSANVTLQQLGLILLLSAIGVRSGNAFVESLSMEGLYIFGASTLISLTTAMTLLFVGYKLVKIPFTLLMGIVANQPAILDFAMERSGSNLPMYGYTVMFPIAFIFKILISQILFMILS